MIEIITIKKNFPVAQTWNPQTYAKNARFVSDLGIGVVEWLNPQAGERILDLGCGDGALTVKLEEFGCEVIGVDSSPDLIASAKSRGLNALLLDAYDLDFQGEFDAVFSNAALHWMKEADLVIEGVWQSLKPGGRFVAEFGGDGNISKIRTALHTVLKQYGIDAEEIDPWYFPTIEDYQSRLVAKGFHVKEIVLKPRPTPLPTDIKGWLTTFANPFLVAICRRHQAPLIAPSAQEAFLTEVITLLEPSLCDASGQWFADYVRLRFCASKPPN